MFTSQKEATNGQKAAADQSNLTALPALSLPKGRAAIRGTPQAPATTHSGSAGAFHFIPLLVKSMGDIRAPKSLALRTRMASRDFASMQRVTDMEVRH